MESNNNNGSNSNNTSSDNKSSDGTSSDDNTSNDNNKSKKSGLSPGGIVGIVLGIIAIVGVGIFLFFYFRRKNKKKEDNMISNLENNKKDNEYRMDLEMENEDITKQKNVHSDSDILSIPDVNENANNHL